MVLLFGQVAFVPNCSQCHPTDQAKIDIALIEVLTEWHLAGAAGQVLLACFYFKPRILASRCALLKTLQNGSQRLMHALLTATLKA
jgi:hypothetical protein